MMIRITPRDQQVLDHLLTGASNKDIGRELNISDRTVKAHLDRLFRSFGTDNRIRLAYLVGKIDPPRAIDHPKLKPSEREAVRLLTLGMSNKDIAFYMNTTEQVIKNCLKRAYDVYGVWSRLELVIRLGVSRVPEGEVWGQAVGAGPVGDVAAVARTEQKAARRAPSVPLQRVYAKDAKDQSADYRVASGA